ncbi:hypothetical protein M9Y10_008145 [Tritrichomonas musculus]|uniref:LisH domain-containing protein n=1 Tax=Tritrichomonas musculus TaxID=1915356 RepID=A0ABR2IXF8_9EUKA
MDTEPFEVPQEIKEKVATKLRNSGALKQISRKIKVGMTAAIHELRNPEAKSSLELQIISPESVEERAGLQSVYQYLEEKGLDYTLSTLQEETGIPKQNNSNVIDILQLIGFVYEDEEEEVVDE